MVAGKTEVWRGERYQPVARPGVGEEPGQAHDAAQGRHHLSWQLQSHRNTLEVEKQFTLILFLNKIQHEVQKRRLKI